MDRKHIPDKSRHLCSYCGKEFSTASMLNYHIMSHTGERNFQCKTCDKCEFHHNILFPLIFSHQKIICIVFSFSVFYKKDNLRSHEMTHLAIRPYLCSYCGLGFARSGNLARHVR